MRIERRFTTEGQDAYEGIAFRRTSSEIRNPDGAEITDTACSGYSGPYAVACNVIVEPPLDGLAPLLELAPRRGAAQERDHSRRSHHAHPLRAREAVKATQERCASTR